MQSMEPLEKNEVSSKKTRLSLHVFGFEDLIARPAPAMMLESEDSPIAESQLRELINGLSANHILKQCPEVYVNGFVEAALGVYEPENLAKVLQQKFFIPAEASYSDEGYYQAASELTVAWDIKKKERQSLVANLAPEKPVRQGSLKNVDVYFEVKSTKVSFEVKCPFEERRETPPENLTLLTAGRLPDHQRKLEELSATLSSGHSAPNIVIGKNRDLRIKDCLVSAHNKFSPSSGFDDLNVLFLSMGHWYRISEWHMCFFGDSGLFGAHSFHPTESFSLVDVVVLSSLKYRHEFVRDASAWTLDDVLLLPILNPRGRRTRASSTVDQGLSIFGHYKAQFAAFKPAGLILDEHSETKASIEEILKVNHFVMERLTAAERSRFFPVLVPN